MTFPGATWWELLLVPVFGAVLFAARRLGVRLRLPRILMASDRRAMIAVGLISLGLAATCSAIRSLQPRVHDEFSYLLAADTFVHGRLTNPTHPMWRHFETMHVLQQPTMQSKYPPAQALFLAAGQVLTSQPIVGVWVSFSLACMAMFWCLRPWAPRGWAFFGGLLPAIRFGSGLYFNDNRWAYWATSYWGGAVALLGGCLAFGAALRMMRGKTGRRESILLGIGLSILATCRPWEGLVLAAPLVLIVLWRVIRDGGMGRALRCLAPAAGVTALCLCGLGYYNYRVTGFALTMPYDVYMETYDVVRIFRFLPFREAPEYRHDVLRRYHAEFQAELATNQLNSLGLQWKDIRVLATFLLGKPLAAAALLGLFAWRSRRIALVFFLLAVAAAGHAITMVAPFWPHYFAPQVPLVIVLALRGLRVLRVWRFRSSQPLRLIADGIVAVTLAAFVGGACVRLSIPREQLMPFEMKRHEIVQQLQAQEGGQLVLVRYSPDHNVHVEWVYNLSEIDQAKIVWARSMSEAENAELLEYFRDRTAWLLEPDERPVRLTPYKPLENGSQP